MASTRARTEQAVEFGGYLEELRSTVPANLATFEVAENTDAVIVSRPGLPPAVLHGGDWITWDDEQATVHSAAAFKRYWTAG